MEFTIYFQDASDGINTCYFEVRYIIIRAVKFWVSEVEPLVELGPCTYFDIQQTPLHSRPIKNR